MWYVVCGWLRVLVLVFVSVGWGRGWGWDWDWDTLSREGWVEGRECYSCFYGMVVFGRDGWIDWGGGIGGAFTFAGVLKMGRFLFYLVSERRFGG